MTAEKDTGSRDGNVKDDNQLSMITDNDLICRTITNRYTYLEIFYVTITDTVAEITLSNKRRFII